MSTKRTRDPAGLLPDKVTVTFDGDPSDFAAVARLLKAASPESRIRRLRSHPELVATADALQARYEAAQSASIEDRQLLADIAAAEYQALYLRAAPKAVEVGRRRAASRAGGKNKQAPAWHGTVIAHAKYLRSAGRQAHELTALCARKCQKSDDAVRRVLQGAGLIPKRKTRAK